MLGQNCTAACELYKRRSILQELEGLRRQAESLKREVEALMAIKERNELRERELMDSMKDYSAYMKVMALVNTEAKKKASLPSQ